MKRNFIVMIGIILFSLFQFASPNSTVHAATYENGTYDVSFELKEAGSDSTSIADGYFSKPAKLIVENGVNYIQLTTTESDWVKSISGPKGDATNVSESGNSRTVQFEVGDLSDAVNLNMHVVVPEDVAGMDYDHHHSVRAIFDTSNVPTSASDAAETNEVEQVTAGGDDETSPTPTKGTENNPKTGDTSPIGVYVFLLILSVSVFVVYELRVSRN